MLKGNYQANISHSIYQNREQVLFNCSQCNIEFQFWFLTYLFQLFHQQYREIVAGIRQSNHASLSLG